MLQGAALTYHKCPTSVHLPKPFAYDAILYGAGLLYQMWSAPCVRFQKGSFFSIQLLASSSINMPCITRLAAYAQQLNHVLVLELTNKPLGCRCIVQRSHDSGCLTATFPHPSASSGKEDHDLCIVKIAVPAMIGGFGNWFIPNLTGASDIAFPPDLYKLLAVATIALPLVTLSPR